PRGGMQRSPNADGLLPRAANTECCHRIRRKGPVGDSPAAQLPETLLALPSGRLDTQNDSRIS
ncbi:MAG: hypothetical protein ABJA98_26570, partial [Acidobacteriota bacterium]